MTKSKRARISSMGISVYNAVSIGNIALFNKRRGFKLIVDECSQ